MSGKTSLDIELPESDLDALYEIARREGISLDQLLRRITKKLVTHANASS